MTSADDPQGALGVLRRYAPTIYGPSALFSLGEGAILPVIPLIAVELGASIALAALVAAAIVIGQVIGNLPAGWLVARYGERWTMILSAVFGLAGAIMVSLAQSLIMFTIAVFWVGLAAAAFAIARHSFMTNRVPFTYRARALSLLGGVYRLGIFLGPFIGALAVSLTGSNRVVGWWFVACLVATLIFVWVSPDLERLGDPLTTETGSVAVRIGVLRTIIDHRGVLGRLGLAAACMSAVRAARQVVIPLWGESLGMDSETILLIVGVSGAIDFALFYLSGQVMDRFGRLWAALPALITMGAGFAVLAVSHDFEHASTWYLVCALIIGVGNGLSSGILMTIGADIAPRHDPAPFLGAWHTLTDGGSAATPLIFSFMVAVSTISWATALIAVVATLGAFGFGRWVPRYVRRPEG